jgi:hypothetical protein
MKFTIKSIIKNEDYRYQFTSKAFNVLLLLDHIADSNPRDQLQTSNSIRNIENSKNH